MKPPRVSKAAAFPIFWNGISVCFSMEKSVFQVQVVIKHIRRPFCKAIINWHHMGYVAHASTLKRCNNRRIWCWLNRPLLPKSKTSSKIISKFPLGSTRKHNWSWILNSTVNLAPPTLKHLLLKCKFYSAVNLNPKSCRLIVN